MDLTTDHPLEMARRHCVEWKDLLSVQLGRTRKLYLIHKMENKTFMSYQEKFMYIANRTKKQKVEIKELECLNQEERTILTEKHFQGDHPFI